MLPAKSRLRHLYIRTPACRLEGFQILKLIGLHKEQWLIVFHRAGIIGQYLYYFAAHFTLDLVKELHGFNNANYFSGAYLITYFYK
jgi:hypothetical protein